MMNSLGFNDQRLGREGFAKAKGNTTMKYQNGGMLVVNKEDTYAAAERCAAAPAPRAAAAAAAAAAAYAFAFAFAFAFAVAIAFAFAFAFCVFVFSLFAF